MRETVFRLVGATPLTGIPGQDYLYSDLGFLLLGAVIEAICGDGLPTLEEACDDGNDADGDGCSAICEIEPGWVCGDGECVCDEDFYGPTCIPCPDCGAHGLCDEGNQGTGDCICRSSVTAAAVVGVVVASDPSRRGNGVGSRPRSCSAPQARKL